MSSPRHGLAESLRPIETSPSHTEESNYHVSHVDDVIKAVRGIDSSLDLSMEKTPLPSLEGFASRSVFGASSKLASLTDEENNDDSDGNISKNRGYSGGAFSGKKHSGKGAFSSDPSTSSLRRLSQTLSRKYYRRDGFSPEEKKRTSPHYRYRAQQRRKNQSRNYGKRGRRIGAHQTMRKTRTQHSSSHNRRMPQQTQSYSPNHSSPQRSISPFDRVAGDLVNPHNLQMRRKGGKGGAHKKRSHNFAKQKSDKDTNRNPTNMMDENIYVLARDALSRLKSMEVATINDEMEKHYDDHGSDTVPKEAGGVVGTTISNISTPESNLHARHKAYGEIFGLDGSSKVEDMLLQEIYDLDKKLEYIAISSPNSPLNGYGQRHSTKDTHTNRDNKSEDWAAYSDDEGNIYFHNQDTGESQWEKPHGFTFDGIDEDRGDDIDDFDLVDEKVELTQAQEALLQMTLNPRQKELLHRTLHPEQLPLDSGKDGNSLDAQETTKDDDGFWDKVRKTFELRRVSEVSESVLSEVGIDSQEAKVEVTDRVKDGEEPQSTSEPPLDESTAVKNGRRATMPGAPPRLLIMMSKSDSTSDTISETATFEAQQEISISSASIESAMDPGSQPRSTTEKKPVPENLPLSKAEEKIPQISPSAPHRVEPPPDLLPSPPPTLEDQADYPEPPEASVDALPQPTSSNDSSSNGSQPEVGPHSDVKGVSGGNLGIQGNSAESTREKAESTTQDKNAVGIESARSSSNPVKAKSASLQALHDKKGSRGSVLELREKFRSPTGSNAVPLPPPPSYSLPKMPKRPSLAQPSLPANPTKLENGIQPPGDMPTTMPPPSDLPPPLPPPTEIPRLMPPLSGLPPPLPPPTDMPPLMPPPTDLPPPLPPPADMPPFMPPPSDLPPPMPPPTDMLPPMLPPSNLPPPMPPPTDMPPPILPPSNLPPPLPPPTDIPLPMLPSSNLPPPMPPPTDLPSAMPPPMPPTTDTPPTMLQPPDMVPPMPPSPTDTLPFGTRPSVPSLGALRAGLPPPPPPPEVVTSADSTGLQLQSKLSTEERSKVWKDAQLRQRREKKEAEQRAAQEALDKMTDEDREEHLRLEEEQTKHKMKKDKHLLLLAKSAGAKRSINKLKSKKKKGRGRSR